MAETLIDGRYRLLNELGVGGEAVVFRAQDIVDGTDVAIRLPRSAVSPDSLKTLPNKPDNHHPGWVDFLGAGIDQKRGIYHVYELLEGKTLRQMVPSGPLAPHAWREFVDQSLASIEALHLAGWVHGDLNADNFLKTDAGWKLLELPFFRFDPAARRSTLFGGIHTLSPEQFDGKQPEMRSDLYSLGCLYYYAASGEYPHPGENSREVAIHCLRFAPQPLREKAPALPITWSDWVIKLIASKPDDRFPTATAARQLLGVA